MTLALRRVQISDTISTKLKVFFIPNKFELVQVKNWHKSSEKPPPAWQKCLWRWHLGMGESLVDCYNVRSHFHFVDQMRGEGTLARARTRPHSFLHSLFSPFNLLSLIECLSLMLISVTQQWFGSLGSVAEIQWMQRWEWLKTMSSRKAPNLWPCQMAWTIWLGIY